MVVRTLKILLLAGVGVALCGVAANAQLPTAQGRQFTLSHPGWKVFIPSTYQQRPGEVADLLVHFHGDPQTVWNNAEFAKLNTIVLTVNYSGLSSAYSGPFGDSALFGSLLDEALTVVRGEPDFSSTLAWDQLGVSSFSAGYGAVREILKQASYRDQIAALLAADSLYATTASDGTPLDSQLADYKTFASLAKSGDKTFVFTHSEVPTGTYESTLETGNEILQHLRIRPVGSNVAGLGSLQFYRTAHSGNFRLWGARGADGEAHLEHLRSIGEFFQQLPLAKLAAPGDFDRDGDVDGADFLHWQRTEGSSGSLSDWQESYGGSSAPPPSESVAVVPEPTTLLLLGLLCAGVAAANELLRRTEGALSPR